MANTANYMEQGGGAWHVDGTLTVGATGTLDLTTGASITVDGTQAATIADVDASTGIANNADEATVVVLKSEYDVLVGAFNDLKNACLAAGIIAAA